MKTKLSLTFSMLLFAQSCLFFDSSETPANNTGENNITNTNNGTIKNNGTNTNNGTIKNNGTNTNNGTIKNNATTNTTSGSNNGVCGDNKLDPSEDCDTNRFRAGCTDFADNGDTFRGGNLKCTTDCKVDVSGCYDHFVKISAGGDFTCGITAKKKILCWGRNQFGQTNSPKGDFTSISSGAAHSCGIREGKTVVCWGLNTDGQSDDKAGQFESVSAGTFHTCGIKVDDESVSCWGRNSNGSTESPAGSFGEVSAGFDHTCGVTTNGNAKCWGTDARGKATAPNGFFTNVKVGFDQSCGVTTNGIVCWGGSDSGIAPTGTFESIGLGSWFGCGLDSSREITCWRGLLAAVGAANRPRDMFKEISIGYEHSCAIRESDDQVLCWGKQAYGRTIPP